MDDSYRNKGIPDQVAKELLERFQCRIVRVAEGGLSDSQVFQCASNAGDFCLRRWPRSRYTQERLSWIHHHIEIAGQKVRRGDDRRILPRLLPTPNGPFCEPVPGEIWELTEWMPGSADYLEAPSDKKLASAMVTLRALHQVWLDAEQSRRGAALVDFSPALRERVEILKSALTRVNQHQRASNRMVGLTLPGSDPRQVHDLAARTRQHLQQFGPKLLRTAERLSAQTTECCFVLRDIWSEHVLFEGDEVSGIIDFGAARIDEPATDVARLLGSLEPMDRGRWMEGWRAYAGVASTQSHVSLERVELLDALGCLLSANQWCRWLTEDGQQFSVPIKWQLSRWATFLKRLDHFPWSEFD